MLLTFDRETGGKGYGIKYKIVLEKISQGN